MHILMMPRHLSDHRLTIQPPSSMPPPAPGTVMAPATRRESQLLEASPSGLSQSFHGSESKLTVVCGHGKHGQPGSQSAASSKQSATQSVRGCNGRVIHTVSQSVRGCNGHVIHTVNQSVRGCNGGVIHTVSQSVRGCNGQVIHTISQTVSSWM